MMYTPFITADRQFLESQMSIPDGHRAFNDAFTHLIPFCPCKGLKDKPYPCYIACHAVHMFTHISVRIGEARWRSRTIIGISVYIAGNNDVSFLAQCLQVSKQGFLSYQSW